MVEEFIPSAYNILKNNSVICKEGVISRTLKGNIAAFGAAVRMGSLMSAVAFFNKQGSASQPRQELLNIILQILKEHGEIQESEQTLFHYICEADSQKKAQAKELVVNAAVAVKLAMNLFELEEPKRTED